MVIAWAEQALVSFDHGRSFERRPLPTSGEVEAIALIGQAPALLVAHQAGLARLPLGRGGEPPEDSLVAVEAVDDLAAGSGVVLLLSGDELLRSGDRGRTFRPLAYQLPAGASPRAVALDEQGRGWVLSDVGLFSLGDGTAPPRLMLPRPTTRPEVALAVTTGAITLASGGDLARWRRRCPRRRPLAAPVGVVELLDRPIAPPRRRLLAAALAPRLGLEVLVGRGQREVVVSLRWCLGRRVASDQRAWRAVVRDMREERQRRRQRASEADARWRRGVETLGRVVDDVDDEGLLEAVEALSGRAESLIRRGGLP